MLSDRELTLIGKANLIDSHESHGPQSLRGFAVIDENGNMIYSQQFDPFGEELEGIIEFSLERLSEQQ